MRQTDRQMIVLSGWMAGSSYWTEEDEDEEEEEEEEEACQIKTVEQFTKTGSRKT